MSNPIMSKQQVKVARRLVWAGKTVRHVSKKLALPYGPVWNAVRGNTWAFIDSPPPVPAGHLKSGRKPNENTVCTNCGLDSIQPLVSGLCSACYTYQWRHGQHRPLDCRHGNYIDIDKVTLRRLYCRYRNGESLSQLAPAVGCCEETLRRRLVENDLLRRSNAGIRQKLTGDTVRLARHLVHIEGQKISEVASRFDVHYVTMYDAVLWRTWKSAGGAKPAINGQKAPCNRCGLQTDQLTGLCLYCQGEIQ